MARLFPILFIHGFNGDPGDWTDSGFRQYLLSHGDLDPDLVRLFRYGIAPDGTYNNRGDLRQIASRLAGIGLDDKEIVNCSVDRLSADSVAKGGPVKVTLVVHSLGGIISRYYLSRSSPDEFGAVYRGNIGRLIQIGSPNRGVDLLRLTKLAPRDSLPWRFIRFLEKLGLAPALPAQEIAAWEKTLDQSQLTERARLVPEIEAAAISESQVSRSESQIPSPPASLLLTDTPIYRQLAPDSPLLAALNVPGTMPDDVECHTFYGDIRVGVRATWGEGGLTLLDYTQSFGDLAVPAYSAREIPGAQFTPHPFVTEKRISLTLRVAQAGQGVASAEPAQAALSQAAFLPETAHARLLSNPAVQGETLSVLHTA